MHKYIISHNVTGECVFVTYAPDEASALNEYAGFRSGYDTIAEMAQSAAFRDLANVSTHYATKREG